MLTAAAPAFLASLVEFVEALTIVLAVSATRGARSAGAGAVAGIALLTALVAGFGPLLGRVPLRALQIPIGIMLSFFGLRWLRKAVLRYAGVVALHDETTIYARRVAALETPERPRAGIDWVGAGTAFNAVVLEGLEVIFIVIAVGATAGALAAASAGAAVAGVAVAGAGFALRAPLARVPENALKLFVGAMLSAFGTFWTAEGFGFTWPGADVALPFVVVGYLASAGVAFALARRALSLAAARRR
jgi:uncharacterized membrane protein